MNGVLNIQRVASAASSTLTMQLLILISFAMAMSMGNMLMAQSLERFLSSLVNFGSMNPRQKGDILRMSVKFNPEYDPSDELSFHQHDVFATDESKDALLSYLYAEIEADSIEHETVEVIASMLSLGALYPTDAGGNSFTAENSGLVFDGPAESSYTGDGNIARLGRSEEFGLGSTNPYNIYNGIWGLAVGIREYALQCHGNGLNILDVTDPANIFRVQFIPMPGGGIWRDVATHVDRPNNKAFAYVGAQGSQGDGEKPTLFVVDLSNLSGNETHAIDENPVTAVNLGETPGSTHTINVARGLLFLNTQNFNEGCRVYDLVADPMNPRFLFKTGGGVGRDCHDSSVMTNVGSRDLLVVSDGSGRTQRIWDITDVDENWTTDTLPAIIGQTEEMSGIYAHSNWATEDGRYLFCFEEGNQIDIAVHDISDPANPILIGTFQFSSDEAEQESRLHNGEIRGQYLYVAYYKAGLRVFDISNPFQPYEVGKTETYRDPNGDGVFENSLDSNFYGAWNTYPYLPSGNVLVSDLEYGLFVVKPSAPYPLPRWFRVSSELNQFGNTNLTWSASEYARGYSVLRSNTTNGTFVQIAEHLTETNYVDESSPFAIRYYAIIAKNGEGIRSSSFTVSSDGQSIRRSKASKQAKIVKNV